MFILFISLYYTMELVALFSSINDAWVLPLTRDML